jgi:hypothetical protein
MSSVRGIFVAVSLGILFLAGCAPAPQPDFRFGVMADIQYGDKPDEGTRHFRQSLECLKDCVADLNGRGLAFTIQCGDIIEGYAGEESRAKSLADLDVVLAEYKKLSCPQFHVLGNHCLMGGRMEVCDTLAIPGGYYAFRSPRAAGWVFVVLDGNGPESDPVGKAQTAWLAQTLKQAAEGKQKVIVFCHYPLLQDSWGWQAKNALPVLKLLEESNCVAAWFNGHEHGGGYAFRNGIHYVTLKGMVENPGAYGVVEVYADRIELVGHGKQPSIAMYFNKAAKPAE